MPISLKESTAIAAMSDVIYDFLPGSGSVRWKGHVTFGSVAAACDVGNYWPAGSKLPAIIALLRQTLQYRRDRFESLILEIVRSGIVYRKKQGKPITENEIKLLNGHILDVGFKFPSLWDPEFLASLRQGSTARAEQHVEQELREQTLRASARDTRSMQLCALKEELIAIHRMADRSAAVLHLRRS